MINSKQSGDNWSLFSTGNFGSEYWIIGTTWIDKIKVTSIRNQFIKSPKEMWFLMINLKIKVKILTPLTNWINLLEREGEGEEIHKTPKTLMILGLILRITLDRDQINQINQTNLAPDQDSKEMIILWRITANKAIAKVIVINSSLNLNNFSVIIAQPIHPDQWIETKETTPDVNKARNFNKKSHFITIDTIIRLVKAKRSKTWWQLETDHC